MSLYDSKELPVYCSQYLAIEDLLIVLSRIIKNFRLIFILSVLKNMTALSNVYGTAKVDE